MKGNHFPSNAQRVALGGAILEIAHEYEELRLQLRERLLDLEYLAFERMILDLLKKSGYINVQLADRMYKRGRTRQGGLDLKAYSETDISRCLTIAQVKQYKDVVPRRFVDELRGTMLRVGAKQGLLIATSSFSEVACQAAASIPFLPITLIDSDALLDLLISRQIGVQQETVQRLVVNREFFDDLK